MVGPATLLRASQAVLSTVCDPVQIFFAYKFSYVLFCNSTNKTGQQVGGGLLIANHLDESLWSTNQKYWAAVRSCLVHSFVQVHSAAAPFTSHRNHSKYAEPKPFCWAKPAHLDLFHPILLCKITYRAPLEMLWVLTKSFTGQFKQPMTKGRDVIGAHNAHNVEKSHVGPM